MEGTCHCSQSCFSSLVNCSPPKERLLLLKSRSFRPFCHEPAPAQTSSHVRAICWLPQPGMVACIFFRCFPLLKRYLLSFDIPPWLRTPKCNTDGACGYPPQWFTNHERGSLKRELASIYHYYLHPENCPDGILRYVPLFSRNTNDTSVKKVSVYFLCDSSGLRVIDLTTSYIGPSHPSSTRNARSLSQTLHISYVSYLCRSAVSCLQGRR